MNELFCGHMHTSFECACNACGSTPQEMRTWANSYWTSDGDAKKLFLDLQSEAQCTSLKNAGAMTLPAGHGCNKFYQRACVAPLNQHYCPNILGEGTSRYGVAGTLENDDVKWIQESKTCRSEEAWERELNCKSKLKKTLDPQGNYCAPHHEFLACMCDACEEDVEAHVDGMARYQRCDKLKGTLKQQTPSNECDLWYSDECVAPLGKDYCEHIKGTKKSKGKPELAESWDDDGMKWGTYCETVIAPLASSPSELEETLGNGWIDFCKKKLGQNATDEHRIVPFGSGENGHKRLAVSGMPAPRTYDLPDPSMGYFNVDPREKLGGDISVEAEGGPKEEEEDVDHSDDVDVPAEEPAEEPAAEPPVGFSPPKARPPFLSPSLLFLFILFPSPPSHLHFHSLPSPCYSVS